ncbi:uncharacterized protein MELLADRAFT_59317 [Melampsora larici-populina 98AG31]|uniref:Uncharacterized protein n=1 Tax=Melampsora larici-populina (strain 98AG31 / pathotype 3-4-7) TaxID=747676 RepID=F4R5V6_MELLP|nr:uncharacterized protein MELLADRAFT_59317 [Melampsora larici-populina 98AG31]EGG12186.1 hypothetical protein MELLADRAFT_59317 [Melampsora larici-populina 98AG31]
MSQSNQVSESIKAENKQPDNQNIDKTLQAVTQIKVALNCAEKNNDLLQNLIEQQHQIEHKLEHLSTGLSNMLEETRILQVKVQALEVRTHDFHLGYYITMLVMFIAYVFKAPVIQGFQVALIYVIHTLETCLLLIYA